MDQRRLDLLIKERENVQNKILKEKRKKTGINLKELFKKIESEEEKVV
jgi:hypothetical protein